MMTQAKTQLMNLIISLTPSATKVRAYRKMKACHVFPVLAMMAAQMFGPTRELTRLKIPYNPTSDQLYHMEDKVDLQNIPSYPGGQRSLMSA